MTKPSADSPLGAWWPTRRADLRKEILNGRRPPKTVGPWGSTRRRTSNNFSFIE